MKVVELIVTLLLGGLIASGAWRAAAGLRHQFGHQRIVAEARDARRVAGLLMDLDAGGLEGPGGPREIAVRAFRWWARPCDGSAVRGGATVVWRGLRRPDPGKDSVRLVAADGEAVVRRLEGVRASRACAPSESLELVWEATGDDPVPVLLRGFERGAYRIDDAFRYRRGAGGAQPLTAAVFARDSTALRSVDRRILLEVGSWPPRRWAW